MAKENVDKLKELTQLTDALAKVFKAAKEDDGEVTWSDLLNPDVWSHGFDVASELGDVANNWDEMMAEVKDLDAEEALELVSHFVHSYKNLFDHLNEAKAEKAE